MRLTIAALATLALAAPAAAQEPIEPTYDPGAVFFTCNGTQDKVKNGQSTWGFSTAAPTASFTAGGGCGFVDTGLAGANAGNNVYDAVAEGQFTGAVKSLNVELHDLVLGLVEANTLGGVSFTAILEVDGVEVLNTTDQDPPLEAVGVVSSTGISQKITFGVDLSRKLIKGEGVHTYRLTIGKYYSDTASGWVGGATEIPSGIQFNPQKIATPTIKP